MLLDYFMRKFLLNLIDKTNVYLRVISPACNDLKYCGKLYLLFKSSPHHSPFLKQDANRPPLACILLLKAVAQRQEIAS